MENKQTLTGKLPDLINDKASESQNTQKIEDIKASLDLQKSSLKQIHGSYQQQTVTEPSVNTTELKLHHRINHHQILQEKLRKLRKQKSSTIEYLRRIYDKEKIAVSLRRTSLLQPKSLQRSQNSPLSDKVVKQIMRQTKQKNQFQQNQTKKLLKQIEQQRINRIKQDEFILNQKRLQKRKAILEKKKKLIEMINIKPQEKPAKLRAPYRTLTDEDYIYLKNKKKDDIIKNESERKSKQMLSLNKERLKTDFQSIRNYAKQYDKMIKTKKEEKIAEKKATLDVGSVKKYQKCSFQAMVEQDAFLLKLEQEEKFKRKKEYRKKVQEFKSYVKEKFHPKSTSKTIFQPKMHLRRTELSKQSIIKMGNSNLTESKKVTRQSNRSGSSFEVQVPWSIPKVSKYKNYLLAMKQQHSQRKSPNPQKELNKLAHKQTLTRIEAQKAIKLAQTAQNQYRIKLKNMQDQDFHLAETKIKCLQSIYKAVSQV